ncbi:MAG: hypothetical protein FWD49_00540 [Firmicutes bacterium]|nr:hypothetical protein [Bacillota bacterium]
MQSKIHPFSGFCATQRLKALRGDSGKVRFSLSQVLYLAKQQSGTAKLFRFLLTITNYVSCKSSLFL